MTLSHHTAAPLDDRDYHKWANSPDRVILYTVEPGGWRQLWAMRDLNVRRDHWETSRYQREVPYDDRYDPAAWVDALPAMFPTTWNVHVLITPTATLPDHIYH